MYFSPEENILLTCANQNMECKRNDHLRGLLNTDDLDWKYLVNASVIHGLSPLLYHNLQRFDNRVPGHVMKQLTKFYLLNDKRNQRIYSELSTLIDALTKEDVELIVLKGTRLAVDVFDEIALRPIGDIDLLIHKEDFEKVRKILGELGYFPLLNYAFRLKYGYGLHFVHRKKNIWLDVQWNIIQKEWDISGRGHFNFEIDRMWKRKIELRTHSLEFQGLSVEDMLFHLCLHLEGHRYIQMILFCDIAEVVKRYQDGLDWDYLISISKKYNQQASIYYALLSVEKLFDTPVPPQVLRKLNFSHYYTPLDNLIFRDLGTWHYFIDDVTTHIPVPSDLLNNVEKMTRSKVSHAVSFYDEISNVITDDQSTTNAIVVPSAYPEGEPSTEASVSIHPGLRLLTPNRELDGKATAIGRSDKTQVQYTFSSSPMKIETNRRRLHKKDIFKPRTDENKELKKSIIEFVRISPENLLLSLIMTLEHVEIRLFNFIQILEFFRKYNERLDWTYIENYCTNHGLESQFSAFLSLAKTFHVGLPERLLKKRFYSSSKERVVIPTYKKIFTKNLKVPKSNHLKNIFYFVSIVSVIKNKREKLKYMLNCLVRFYQEDTREKIRTIWSIITLPIQVIEILVVTFLFPDFKKDRSRTAFWLAEIKRK